MRQLGTVTLHIEPATTAMPARVSVAVAGPTTRPDEAVYLTAQCVTLDELEGQINGLQDELDVLRAEARRVFADQAGHA
ncbi:hypothetical protein OPKNFCMD_1803 [Methylobacterium crusticola]|uniref:DUF480 domain-containing protein n=1 Tax=Methylobacterium crusticola TaxID=1697972 RepID=A0ABQ4QVW6_9HYPH|nr:hypothetical protein [Methylobacterium crusticola]GJD49074.1 hypothetical protein OPKNFCMD_1803 [Methylobacterium crusticola]